MTALRSSDFREMTPAIRASELLADSPDRAEAIRTASSWLRIAGGDVKKGVPGAAGGFKFWNDTLLLLKEPKTMTKAQQRRDEIENNKKIAYAAKVRRLLGHLVGQRLHTDPIMEAYRAGKTAEAFAAEVAAREPVGKAVFPLKASAVEAASKKAQQTIRRVRNALSAADWNLDVAAPRRERTTAAHHEVQAAQHRRSLFQTLTEENAEATRAWHNAAPHDFGNEGEQEVRRAYYRAGKPNIVTMSDRGCERFIAHAEEQAAFEYDAFVCKLVQKVGDCDQAKLDGDHVWSHSILTVHKANPSDSGPELLIERWKTQQIWNVSVLGNHFPQWPTRLMK